MGMLRKIFCRAFYAAAAVSGLLLAATLILWPVSYVRDVNAGYKNAADTHVSISGVRGRAIVEVAPHIQVWGALPDAALAITVVIRPGPDFSTWSYTTWRNSFNDMTTVESLGVGFFSMPAGASSWIILAIPCSYLSLFFAILPLLALRLIRRRRKKARDTQLRLCPKCGYDLRAHGAGQVCPECGTPVAAQPKS